MRPEALRARRARRLMTCDTWREMVRFLAATRHHIAFRNDALAPVTSAMSAQANDYGAGTTGAKRLQKKPSPRPTGDRQ